MISLTSGGRSEELGTPQDSGPVSKQSAGGMADEEKPEASIQSAAESASQNAAKMGPVGNVHKLIVDRLAIESCKLGFRRGKEARVPDDRADLARQSPRHCIAIEVAVRNNTAHEPENLEKCLASGFPIVVSLSAEGNVLSNIKATAKNTFKLAEFKRLKFLTSDECIARLTELANEDARHEPTPPLEVTKTAGGWKFRVRHHELSPEGRRELEAEQIKVIVELVKNRKWIKIS